MNITLNGNALTVEGVTNIATLLKAKGYDGKLVAVAVNGHFLSKEKYKETELRPQDKIEIVAPMQGG